MVPELVDIEPGQVDDAFGKHMLVCVSQQKTPLAGGVHVFWQSASMLHCGMQPEFIPVVVLPPPLLVLPFPPPEAVPLPAPVLVLVCPPTPPAGNCVSLPEAQAAKTAALVEKRATKVSLTYFTVVARGYASRLTLRNSRVAPRAS